MVARTRGARFVKRGKEYDFENGRAQLLFGQALIDLQGWLRLQPS